MPRDPHHHPRAHPLARRLPRVLLVHDDPAFALLIKEAFLWHGCRVRIESARCVDEALRRLARAGGADAPDLVLIGLPPYRGGDQLLADARFSRAALGVPFVQLVHLHRPIDEARALALGADLFFELPSDWDGYKHLVESARQLLALHRDEDDDAVVTSAPRLPLVTVVHDDPGLVHLVRQAFLARGIALAVAQARDLTMLEHQVARPAGGAPRLIILADGQPREALAVLRMLKSSDRASGIPVIVLCLLPGGGDPGLFLAAGAECHLDFPAAPGGTDVLVDRAMALIRGEVGSPSGRLGAV